MSIKNFLMKKMLGNQLKKSGLPQDQQDKLMNAMIKNPQLFEKMGKEIKALEKAGKNQMFASVEVMKKYESELRDLMK